MGGGPTEKELNKYWKEKEDGISSISASLIDQNNIYASVLSTSNYKLGFIIQNPNQVIAMGPEDIRVTHDKRTLRPTVGLLWARYYYPDDLISNTSNEAFDYNEVAIYRHIRELSNIKPGTYGGKLKPDYIFSYGIDHSKEAIEQAKKMGIKYVIVCDEQKYEEKKLVKEPKKSVSREKSELIKAVEAIVEEYER